jgi:hypothetical protein
MILQIVDQSSTRLELVTFLSALDGADRLIAVAARTRYRHWWIRADRESADWVITKLGFQTIDAVRGSISIFDFWFPIHSRLRLLETEHGCAALLFNLVQFIEDHEGREFFEIGPDAPFQPHLDTGKFKEEFGAWFIRRGTLE